MKVIIYMWLEVTLLKVIPSELKGVLDTSILKRHLLDILNNIQHDHKHILFS